MANSGIKPTKSACGVEMNVIPVANNELVYVTVMFYGGQWVQAKRLQSDFTVRQLRSGTATMTADEVDETLDFYGASLAVGSAGAFAYVQLTALRRTLASVLPLFADILAEPAFDQQRLDIAIEEGIMVNSIALQRTQEQCKRQFVRRLLGNEHPMAQFPETADYQHITRDDLISYHRQFLHFGNAVVYLTGMVDEGIEDMVRAQLGRLAGLSSQPRASLRAFTAKDALAQIAFGSDPMKSRAEAGVSLRMGCKLPHALHADYPAILFTTTALGGYFGSRLMANIRERLGLTYGIGAQIVNLPHDSYVAIATDISPESVSLCVDEIRRDIRRLQSEPMSYEEIGQVKNYMRGHLCRATEASYQLVSTIMTNRAIGRSMDDIQQCHQRVMALTAADVQRAATEYFHDDEMLVAVAGNATDEASE